MGQFEASNPIYLQLVERLCHKIVRGEIKRGEKLLSVREMAIDSGVNPNTIQRTYGELERMGIVETRRGQGTFVVDDENKMLELKSSMKIKVIESFVINMKQLGITDIEMKEGLNNYLQQKKEGEL